MDRYSSGYTFWRQFLNCHIYPVGAYCPEVGGSLLPHFFKENCWEAWLKKEDIPKITSASGTDMARLIQAVRGGDIFLVKNSGSGVRLCAVGVVLMKASPVIHEGRLEGFRVPVEWVLNESKAMYDGLLGNLRTTIGDGAHITSPVWQSPEHKDLYESQILRARARFLDTHTEGCLSPVIHV